MRFEMLVGYSWDFFGVENNIFVIGAGNNIIAFEALEDPDDGYRSHLDKIESVSLKNIIYNRNPIAEIKIVEIEENSFHGYHFIDVKDNHIWLKVGTDNWDDYYPCFQFDFHPKKNESL